MFAARRCFEQSREKMVTVLATRSRMLGHAQSIERAEKDAGMRMATETKRWTLEEVHSLPDDGNRYELVHGDLYVTPPPTDPHETIAARLRRIIDPFVEKHGLGLVFSPKAVFRLGSDVQLEPDLMVRQLHPDPRGSWETAPLPLLVVEVLSPTTRRRDFGVKRSVYIDEAGIPEYWVLDGEARTVTVMRSGVADVVVNDRLIWAPPGATEPLVIDLAHVFR